MVSEPVLGREGAMYGTTMIGTLAAGVSADDVRNELKAWQSARQVPGFKTSHIMVAEDGKTVVNVAVFDSKEAYFALADDPEQSKWWAEHYAPLLDGEPRWIDGSWLD
jgi:antibiotic biosynthesis monooxygenase (ABM) superfamily enzyme